MFIWSEHPAREWNEAYPIGNGKLGGMLCGGVNRETIFLNEESIWSGQEINRINPDAKKTVKKIRKLLAQGNVKEAEKKAITGLSGIPQSQRAYQSAGELFIDYERSEAATDYRRELDLEKAVFRTYFRQDKTKFMQEAFVSYENNVLLIKLRSSDKGKLSFKCRFGRSRNLVDKVITSKKDRIIGFYGNTSSNGIGFEAMLKACNKDGEIEVIGEHIIVRAASEVVLYLAISTSFREANIDRANRFKLKRAIRKGYDKLLEEHIAGYSALFQKVKLHIDGQDSDASTERRLECVKNGENDNKLIELYFNYGKYLLISSSRGDSLPANLQGIWNKEIMPPWESKFTININLQMNYWMAESTGLSECHMPFFKLLEKVNENGKETAKKMYGCRGSVAHHNTDIYGDTAPQDHYIPASYWVMGEAWMALHIWMHYEYTHDKEFLEKHVKIMEDCIQFFADFLIVNSNGEMVTSPSVSPENTYIMNNGQKGCMCEGPTMDNEILRALIRDYESACKVLGRNTDTLLEAERIRNKLPKYKVGKYGQLQEWNEDYEEFDPGHRHISHLFGVYPDDQINTFRTPQIMKAAKKTLDRRLENGGGHTGWSKAWIVALYCRFHEGELAYKNLMELFANSTMRNLMDSHPMAGGDIFQIDGNLGASAAILEMVIQSVDDKILLLPALSKEIETGTLEGVCVKGAASCDVYWEKSKVTHFSIEAKDDFEKEIHINGEVFKIKLSKGEVFTWNPNF